MRRAAHPAHRFRDRTHLDRQSVAGPPRRTVPSDSRFMWRRRARWSRSSGCANRNSQVVKRAGGRCSRGVASHGEPHLLHQLVRGRASLRLREDSAIRWDADRRAGERTRSRTVARPIGATSTLSSRACLLSASTKSRMALSSTQPESAATADELMQDCGSPWLATPRATFPRRVSRLAVFDAHNRMIDSSSAPPAHESRVLGTGPTRWPGN